MSRGKRGKKENPVITYESRYRVKTVKSQDENLAGKDDLALRSVD